MVGDSVERFLSIGFRTRKRKHTASWEPQHAHVDPFLGDICLRSHGGAELCLKEEQRQLSMSDATGVAGEGLICDP